MPDRGGTTVRSVLAGSGGLPETAETQTKESKKEIKECVGVL